MNTVERYAEMLAAKRKPFALVDGQLFVRQEQWITPFGPAAQQFTVTPSQTRDLLKKLGGWWVSWTEGFGPEAAASEWYAVICRHFTPLDKLPAKRRYEVNRGLKNCEVRQVDAAEIAQNGHAVHVAALIGYSVGNAGSVPTVKEFSERVLTDAPFADVKHHWAVYHEGRMIAFAQCYLYGRTEVDYTLIKLHPQHLGLYPAYALIHRMNEFYLGAQGFGYVNDGWRSIFHETGVQDFLIQKFNFEKAPANLRVQFRPPLGALLHISTPLHAMLSRREKRFKAVLELRRLRASTTAI